MPGVHEGSYAAEGAAQAEVGHAQLCLLIGGTGTLRTRQQKQSLEWERGGMREGQRKREEERERGWEKGERKREKGRARRVYVWE